MIRDWTSGVRRYVVTLSNASRLSALSNMNG
jgi:hypothetical protein